MKTSIFLEGLKIKLDKEKHTSIVVSSPDATGNVFIPKFIEYKGMKYPIISISDRAFNDNKIESLTFAKDSEVRTFETLSFLFTSIKKLQIPPSLTNLQDNWYYNIKDLEKIEVSPENKNFRDYNNNQYLLGKSDENSESFNVLHLATFNITEAQIPSDVQIIKTNSFFKHDQISSVIFSENSKLRIIERKSFSSSKNIQKLVLPSSVENIDSSNFDGLDSLFEVRISPNNNFYSIFEDKILLTKSNKNSQIFDCIVFCRRDIEELSIPSFIKKISEYSFYGCKKLKSLKFDESSSLEKIGRNAFMGCYSLCKLVVPSSVSDIDDKAFYACEKLESAHFLAENVVIPRYGLYKCSSLREISFPNASYVDFTDDTSFFEIPADCKVVVKNGAEIENLEGFGGQVVYI